jgi:hypothetical protein
MAGHSPVEHGDTQAGKQQILIQMIGNSSYH